MSGEGRLTPEVRAVAIVVIVGAVMSILDTTIVNVALQTLSRDCTHRCRRSSGSDRLPALAGHGHPAHRLGGRALRSQAGVDVRRRRFAITSALCGVAWSAEALIAFRVLQGIAGGMIMPIGMITLAQAAGPERMGG